MADPRPFEFIAINRTDPKPRETGLTEIGGPPDRFLGLTGLSELLSMTERYVDIFTFASGTMRIMPLAMAKEYVRIAHYWGVLVSTGGMTEHVLTRRGDLIERYLDECRALALDIVEVSTDRLSVPQRDLVRLIGLVQEHKLKAKPKLGIETDPRGEAVASADRLLRNAQTYLEKGAWKVLVKAAGITENVPSWRADFVAAIVRGLGPEHVIFEAGSPEVYGWYIREYGPDVSLRVEHRHAAHLSTIRAGLEGDEWLWRRAVTIGPSG
jgi:phosphosulfolactate synthase (CoM biosynthesis protein A)